jgi:uncharacterized protein YhaN
MRIRRLSIDGYGCFSRYEVELAPGLHVIFGPNEQGKSTLRGYIGDMLYGQKRSTTQRLYDESNALRCPWTNPEVYGGRLTYQLDDGRAIEVYRRFDRKNETVQVYDRTHARDVTAEFEQLRNREPQFALSHLGLTKEVFLNTATITHMTLEDLGDEDALAQIREKLLALADSGEEESSADAALRRIETRVAAIGPHAARTRPLPAARARLADLDREWEQAHTLHGELAAIEARRRHVLDDIEALRQRRAVIEADLRTLERRDRVERLREAERLAAGIDEATQRCFTLGGVRDFPCDQTLEVQRAHQVVLNAQAQLERTRAERAQLEVQANAELGRIGETARFVQDIPEEFDQRLTEVGARIQRLRDRRDDIENARGAAEKRLHTAEEEFASLPDFSQAEGDPLARLNQIVQSFRAGLSSRKDEGRKRDALRDQIERRRAAIAAPEAVFSKCRDFPTAAREYEVTIRMRDERIAQLKTGIETLHTAAEEHGERIPGFGWLAAVTTALLIVLVVVSFLVGNSGILVAAGLTAIAAVYFASSTVQARRTVARSLKQIEDNLAEIQRLQTTEDGPCTLIERMIVEARCQTLRELEGRHDQYRQASLELASLVETCAEQERIAREAEEHAARLFDQYVRELRSVGEEIAQESDIEPAVGRAMARYQHYRDAKRRIAENREQIKRYEAEAVQGDLSVALEEERGLALEVRRLMRENGYPEESKHDSASIALRSYRIRNAQWRSRVDVLKEKIVEFDRRIEAETQDSANAGQALAQALASGKCETIEQWHERDKQAREYQDVRDRLSSLQDQLHVVLHGNDLKDLRAAVEADEAPLEVPARSAEDLRRDHEAVLEETDVRMKEAHALEIALTERAAGTRSLNEVEEDRAVMEQRVRDLEFEMDAAQYAADLIEEIARDKHSRIAPRLAGAAGGYLRDITGGAYEELLISRDLRITVRIPQTQRMSEDPENVLSKGTVDQIYLALRLAMVQSLSEQGESIPLLLDDPFGSYDDQRLRNALNVLARIGVSNQVLLFTCREDVARLAPALDTPVLKLRD